MGYGSWNSADWKKYSSARISGKKVNDIYKATGIDAKYDPRKISFRESLDSADHPVTTPIIIGLDVTGSMSDLLDVTTKRLGEMVKDIIERQPVEGPQIMFCAVGDSRCDRSPLQATQFESDIRIASQLTELWFERGGGGNSFESYPLVWYLAANKTKTDAWDKRRKKGVIFTLGDDGFPEKMLAKEMRTSIKEIYLDFKKIYYNLVRACLQCFVSCFKEDLLRFQAIGIADNKLVELAIKLHKNNKNYFEDLNKTAIELEDILYENGFSINDVTLKNITNFLFSLISHNNDIFEDTNNILQISKKCKDCKYEIIIIK